MGDKSKPQGVATEGCAPFRLLNAAVWAPGRIVQAAAGLGRVRRSRRSLDGSPPPARPPAQLPSSSPSVGEHPNSLPHALTMQAAQGARDPREDPGEEGTLLAGCSTVQPSRHRLRLERPAASSRAPPAAAAPPLASHANSFALSKQVQAGQPGLQKDMKEQPVSDRLPTQHGARSWACFCLHGCCCNVPLPWLPPQIEAFTAAPNQSSCALLSSPHDTSPCQSRPAGDQEVLTLETYTGVGKFKGKVRAGHLNALLSRANFLWVVCVCMPAAGGAAAICVCAPLHPSHCLPPPVPLHPEAGGDYHRRRQVRLAWLHMRTAARHALQLAPPRTPSISCAMPAAANPSPPPPCLLCCPSGIGRAVALLLAKEGAKAVAIVHLPKEQPVSALQLRREWWAQGCEGCGVDACRNASGRRAPRRRRR